MTVIKIFSKFYIKELHYLAVYCKFKNHFDLNYLSLLSIAMSFTIMEVNSSFNALLTL